MEEWGTNGTKEKAARRPPVFHTDLQLLRCWFYNDAVIAYDDKVRTRPRHTVKRLVGMLVGCPVDTVG